MVFSACKLGMLARGWLGVRPCVCRGKTETSWWGGTESASVSAGREGGASSAIGIAALGVGSLAGGKGTTRALRVGRPFPTAQAASLLGGGFGAGFWYCHEACWVRALSSFAWSISSTCSSFSMSLSSLAHSLPSNRASPFVETSSHERSGGGGGASSSPEIAPVWAGLPGKHACAMLMVPCSLQSSSESLWYEKPKIDWIGRSNQCSKKAMIAATA
mmetsp:Transcript_19357/g.49018  ORF Transcript_19357/g.49018 Transcript_19357/m.49018 type:complete len:217 (-) Transcript_19357:2053-2703(-)